MIDRLTAAGARASARPQDAAERQPVDDDRFNDEMVRIMTEAADLRAERGRIRSGEDERLAAAESAAVVQLIRDRARPQGVSDDASLQPRLKGPGRQR